MKLGILVVSIMLGVSAAHAAEFKPVPNEAALIKDQQNSFGKDKKYRQKDGDGYFVVETKYSTEPCYNNCNEKPYAVVRVM